MYVQRGKMRPFKSRSIKRILRKQDVRLTVMNKYNTEQSRVKQPPVENQAARLGDMLRAAQSTDRRNENPCIENFKLNYF